MADSELPVSGYILQMAVSGSTNYQTVYDGSDRPQILEARVEGLTTGESYEFLLYAVNYNEISDPSPVLQVSSCISPSQADAPTLVESTPDYITIKWTEPEDNGGCPISGY